ncbi:MAG: hypothetical protein Q9217_002990 [Psora testacea]
MLLRSGQAAHLRSTFRYLSTAPARNTTNLARLNGLRPPIPRISEPRKPMTLALANHQPRNISLQRYQSTTASPYDHIDKKHEDAAAREKIEPQPEAVSSTSSVHQVFHEQGVEDPEQEADVLAGVKEDLVGNSVINCRTIKDTFALDEVPREALIIGMAGVLPYLATSLSTVYLAWDINHASIDGQGFLLSGQTAELLLHIVEPLQVGYGAIISFLGAIHWGLEWAKYGGVYSYRRYAYGVVAPAVAWPTILFPIEYALIAQFSAFVFLYFADARAVVNGWAPHWYSTYRFVLTFVVGASIVISLIGRGQIADKINRLPSPADRIQALRDSQLEAMETEERLKRERMMAMDDGEDNDEEEEDEEAEEAEDGDDE